MLTRISNFKVAHWALVAAAVAVGLLRNHGILTHDDFDLIASGLAAFGVGLNINLTSSGNAVFGAPSAAPDPGPDAQV